MESHDDNVSYKYFISALITSSFFSFNFLFIFNLKFPIMESKFYILVNEEL